MHFRFFASRSRLHESKTQKSRAATRLFQQLIKHNGAIMDTIATPGNTPHVAVESETGDQL